MWSDRQPVMWAAESHDIIEDREKLSAAMDAFREMGVKAIGMEAFRKADQQILNDYAAGKVKRDVIVKLLKDWGWAPQSYANFVDAALDMNKPSGERKPIQILALRKSPKKPDDPQKTDEAKKPDNLEAQVLKDLIRFEIFKRDYILQNNESWATDIADWVKAHPGELLVCLVGGDHTDPKTNPDKESVAQKLRAKGVDSLVVRFEDDYHQDKHTIGSRETGRRIIISKNDFAQLAEGAGLANENFYVKNADQGKDRMCDYFLYLHVNRRRYYGPNAEARQ